MKLKSVLKGTFMGIALFVVHALISAGAFLWHYTLSAGRFDGHAGSSVALQLAQVIKAVCFFPFASILFEWVPLGGVWGWMPVVVNSAVVAVSVILASTATLRR